MLVRGISPSAHDKFIKRPVVQSQSTVKPVPYRPTIYLDRVEPPKPFTRSMIRTIGFGLAGRPSRPSLKRWSGPQRIIEEVASKHRVSIPEMRGQSRTARFVRARHEAWYRIRKECGYSLPEIARLFGDRDHTTVLHGIRRHSRLNGLPA